MDQAKKRQIYEMNQKLTQKKFEKKEKLNKIKSEQNAIKKRIEAERANKNIQKNNYDLSVRKNLIEIKIQIKDLFAYQNRQKINNICNIYIYNSDIYIIWIYIFFFFLIKGKQVNK